MGKEYVSLKELCDELAISVATGRNWVKLGKLSPEYAEKKTVYFSKEYVRQYKRDIQIGNNTALKSRRNKRYISGYALYQSYVSDQCANIGVVQELLSRIDVCNEELDDEKIQILAADCAVKLFYQRYGCATGSDECSLLGYMDRKISFGRYDSLIDVLISRLFQFDRLAGLVFLLVCRRRWFALGA